MITSGYIGEQNKKNVIDRYRDLFAKKTSLDAANIILRSTEHMEFGDRVWELERLLTGKSREQIAHEREHGVGW